MRRLVRIFFFTICFSLLVGITADSVPKAYAATGMTASDACVDFIKAVEGFSAKPYYDYSQHTVGYGTRCPDDKYFDYLANGIPEEEAEALLQETLSDIEDSIHKKLMEPYGLSFTQNQFDALVSFTFNLGPSWMTYDSTLRNAILRNASDDELVYAFSLYCTVGGNYSTGLINRRLCEADLYLNGVYSQNASKAYGYVFYDPNGGSLTYRIQGFLCVNNPAPVADAVRNNDVFLGWYTELNGGSQVTELTKALSGKTLFARWQSSENSENQNSHSTFIRVTGDVVNIRKGPGTNYGIAKQVYQNDVLILSHVTYLLNTKWGKVQDGWICLDYTNYEDGSGTDTPATETTPPSTEETSTPDTQDVVSGTVRVNDLLRIRSGPGTAFDTVGYLSDGNTVEILEQQAVGTSVWGRITRGWISMDYVEINSASKEPDTDLPQETTPEQTPASPTLKTVGRVTADALRIRPAAGAVNSILGFYYQNDMVMISEKVLVGSVYWGKTDKGWISLDYVSMKSPMEESTQTDMTGEKTVIADCLRVRMATGTDSRIAELLYYGAKVTVLETKSVNGTIWGRVHNGWICMDYVK